MTKQMQLFFKYIFLDVIFLTYNKHTSFIRKKLSPYSRANYDQSTLKWFLQAK
jgi:uncharacterized membrane protein (UPF0127 family)